MLRSKGIIFLCLMLVFFSCKTKGPNKQAETLPQRETIDNNSESFSMELSSEGILFKISVLRKGEEKELLVSTKGLKIRDYNERFDIVGELVVDAQLADLNGDNSPELLIYTQSVGSGSYGKAYVFSVNNLKSMSAVYMLPIYDDENLRQGYMGHDRFEVVDNTLVHHLPIYKEGDSNANPTGGVRQVIYTLVDGEASRRLEVLEFKDLEK